MKKKRIVQNVILMRIADMENGAAKANAQRLRRSTIQLTNVTQIMNVVITETILCVATMMTLITMEKKLLDIAAVDAHSIQIVLTLS